MPSQGMFFFSINNRFLSMRIKFIFLLFLIICISIKAGETVDYLIISDPQKLSIFNQFEQALSDKEFSRFYPFSPLQIINRKETLGDQITEALKCNYLGTTYFILTDNKGEPRSSSSSIYKKIFRNCNILNDTVTINKNMNVYERFPASGKIHNCKIGQSIIRIFRHSDYVYVFIPENKQFGWTGNITGLFKKSQKKHLGESVLEIDDIVDIVDSRLKSVNDDYEIFFNYFNNLTQQGKAIPEWTIINDGKQLRCKLNASGHISEQLSQSTRYVVQDIEQMLLGKPFVVQYASGEIIINHR